MLQMLHFVCGKGPRSRCYESTAALTLIVQPWDEDEEKDDQFFFSFFQVMEYRWKEIDSATLSTTNPIWTDPGWNPGLRGGRPATNRLSHGTALMQHLY
jgi:hypothetical protein